MGTVIWYFLTRASFFSTSRRSGDEIFLDEGDDVFVGVGVLEHVDAVIGGDVVEDDEDGFFFLFGEEGGGVEVGGPVDGSFLFGEEDEDHEGDAGEEEEPEGAGFFGGDSWRESWIDSWGNLLFKNAKGKRQKVKGRSRLRRSILK